MKFALTNGQRQEAQPGLAGECPSCSRPTIAKCGEVKVWHWAHREKRVCDVWWENETEWHRTWKGHFPTEWQEIVHHAEDGEKHIADVKTDQGWVLEFQHSFLKPEERRSRDAFYPNLVWVVDGMRRKKDQVKLQTAWQDGVQVGALQALRKIHFPEECMLLREWMTTRAPVFFDFGEEARLWWLLPNSPDGKAYVIPYSRAEFIQVHRGGDAQKVQEFAALLKQFNDFISMNNELHRIQASNQERLRFQQMRPQFPRRSRRF